MLNKSLQGYLFGAMVIFALLFAGNWFVESFTHPKQEPTHELINGNTKFVFSYIGHNSLFRSTTAWYDREIDIYERDSETSGWKLIKSTLEEYNYPFFGHGGGSVKEVDLLTRLN